MPPPTGGLTRRRSPPLSPPAPPRYDRGMSREPPDPPPPARPPLAASLLLLPGCGVSLLLVPFTPLGAEPGPGVPEGPLREVVSLLPGPMRLPEGVILFWPFFFGLQRLRGRSEGLTSGEWLWVLSWFGVALLTGLGAWQ